MALKNGSSGMLGLLDVTSSWEAFEVINKCHVVTRLESVRTNHLWVLEAHATAWSGHPTDPEARFLVSASVRCSASEWPSLDVVVFRLLYALDGKLAELEMNGTVRE